ncbi:MAG: deaminase [Candidatus Pacearchaeota archaeon]
MRYLYGSEKNDAMRFILIASEIAKRATCQKDKCGSIVVKDRIIIGKGANSPPNNLESQRRCLKDKNTLDRKVTDKTCCVHAEQRAIMDALINNSDKIENSRLYFARLESGAISFAGKPYCTICSKMALDVGIREFVLFHEQGIAVYDTEEYNLLSFGYRE